MVKKKNKTGGRASSSSSYENYYTQYNSHGYRNSYGSGYGVGYYSSNYGYNSRNKYSKNTRNDNNYGWSWGNFSFARFEEKDDNLIVRSTKGYVTPSSSTIRQNLGYSIKKETIDFVKNMARYFYFKMLEEPNIYEDKYLSNLDQLPSSELEEFNKINNFIESIKNTEVPGYTPLEKAFHLAEKLSRTNSREGGLEGALNQLDSVTDQLEFDTDTFSDPIYNELNDLNDFSKRYKFDILDKISLIKKFGSKFKIEIDIDEKEVEFSSLTAIKKMRSMSQFRNIEIYQRMLPTFKLKLATKDLLVKTCIDKTESKQKIIVLIDYSGSMSNTEKQKWVCAFLINRLKYVIKEECELFVSFFVHDPRDLHFTHIYNRDTAVEFWKKFSTRPNGGDTNIGAMINKLDSEINSKKKLCNLDIDISNEKIEALIINDGQDSIKTNNFAYKTNAMSLFGYNGDLKSACLNNNGKYVTITTRSEVKEYE